MYGGGRFKDFKQEFQDKINSYGPIWFHASRTSVFPSFKTFGNKLYSGGQLREKGLFPLSGEGKGSFGLGPNKDRVSGYTDPVKLQESMMTYTQYGSDFDITKMAKDFKELNGKILQLETANSNEVGLPEDLMPFLTKLARYSYFVKSDIWNKIQKSFQKVEDKLIEHYFGKAHRAIKKFDQILGDNTRGLNLDKWKEKYQLDEFIGKQNLTTFERDFESLLDLFKNTNQIKKALPRLNNSWYQQAIGKMFLYLINLKANYPEIFNNQNKRLLREAMSEAKEQFEKAKKAMFNLIHKKPPISYSKEDREVITNSKPIIFGFNDKKLFDDMIDLSKKKLNYGDDIKDEALVMGPIDLNKYLKFVIVNCDHVTDILDLLREYNLKDVDILCDMTLSCKSYYL
jgi:ribosomal 50S subunit-associated protein YjgA (DUF615 family)